MLDCRYQDNHAIKSLSSWLHPHLKCFSDPRIAAYNLSQFFTSNSKNDTTSRRSKHTRCAINLQSENCIVASPTTTEYLNQSSQTSIISFTRSSPKKTDLELKDTESMSRKRKKIKMICNQQTEETTESQHGVDHIEIKPGGL